MSGLQLPQITTENLQGKAVSESSHSSDDHFSSASEGTPNPNRLSAEIPITRVERVDDKAAHGEVPGTPAYDLRTQDAVPDEIEIVPEGRRSRSATGTRSRSHSALSQSSRPQTPGGTPVPRMVVDRVDDKPAHGEVPGTPAYEMRMADAIPDEVRKSTTDKVADGSATSGIAEVGQDPEDKQAWFRSMWEGKTEEHPSEHMKQEKTDQIDDDDDFGDDFDDFAEGGEGDDFGDFDEATPTAQPDPEPQPQQQAPPSVPSSLASLPPLDLKLDLSGSDLQDTITPYLDLIFPDTTDPPPASSLPPVDMTNSSPFLSDRSLSLWQQLVSPPPMQPPNWTRSRIRRLFLVSLGVPVDLDEILPPSKQKRLVLPNINLTSPRASTAQLERLRQEGANDSSTSVDSKTGERKRGGLKRSGTVKGPPPPPDFDSNRAMLICRTTEEALKNMEDMDLKDHVFTLEILNKEASKVLEYWLQRKDDAVKEKEALEGVIENLVGFVKGRRGGK